MELRRPLPGDRQAIEEMVAEFTASQSAHDGSFWQEGAFDYEAWLQTNRDQELGLNLPEGWVPAIQFVAFDEKGGALGFCNLRLRLNDYLLTSGGHIGYSVRPSQRKKGYAKEILRQALLECPGKNIKSVLVTCSIHNPASRAVIVANGGQLEDVRGATERYWIAL